MISVSWELRHLSHSLIGRGVAMLGLGVAAVMRPEEILIFAMLSVGIIASMLGLYDVSVALAIRSRARGWWLVLLHGVVTLSFGMLSVGATGLSFGLTLGVIAAWMTLSAALHAAAAAVIRPLRVVRWTLVATGSLDAVLAILVLAYPQTTIFALLFFGAVYAAWFGAWQIAVGAWLLRALQRHPASSLDERPEPEASLAESLSTVEKNGSAPVVRAVHDHPCSPTAVQSLG